MPRAWVVVLGDVGRSPRMQYHTLSLCNTPGYDVDVIGLRGSALIDELQKPLHTGKLNVHYLPELPSWLRRLPRVPALALKALFQFVVLAWLCWVALPRPDSILLQIPPAIPTMAVLRGAALFRGARLVFDWHNFAYTLMALGMGSQHLLVRLAKRYERRWAPTAAAHLCVSEAMSVELARRWDVPDAAVFYDRPAAGFRRCDAAEAHGLLQRLRTELSAPLHVDDWLAAEVAAAAPGTTPRSTRRLGGGRGVELLPRRPALIVSGTSWTPDEDFGLLLHAAELYEAARDARRGGDPLPRLVFCITGRGPGRAAYEATLAARAFRHVAFRLLWLSTADYRCLLGSADLGVCLHASSSGLDLPMKAVDMLGAGLPVAALRYPTITELVRPGENGALFDSAQGLADALITLLAGWPDRCGELERLRAGAAIEGDRRWDPEWRRVVLPLIKGDKRNHAQTRR